MCYINGVFAQSSNWRHVRTGHLFGERFTSLVVPRELYLKRAARYIVLNPVEAGLVRHPADWPWSSYRASVGIEAGPAFLYREWQLWAFDTTVEAEAQRIYCEYIKQGMTDHGSAIEDDLLEELEEITRAKYRDRILPRTCADNSRPSLDELLMIPGLPRSARNLRIFEAHTVHGYRLSEIAKVLKMDRSTPGVIVRRFQNGSPNSRSSS